MLGNPATLTGFCCILRTKEKKFLRNVAAFQDKVACKSKVLFNHSLIAFDKKPSSFEEARKTENENRIFSNYSLSRVI